MPVLPYHFPLVKRLTTIEKTTATVAGIMNSTIGAIPDRSSISWIEAWFAKYAT
jgi:hypothetical protein